MLEKATIARPYANAAFDQAIDESKLSEWSAMLNLLSVIVSDDSMYAVINNPKLSSEALYQFFSDIGGDKFSQTGKNFIRVLIDAGRINLAAEVFEIFEQKRTATEGISDVEVISAYPLDNAQVNAISESISKRLGKKIDINTEEDKDLIGGVIIRVGDSVIDASLRGRLKELNSIFAQ
ncbi:MAG TPA: F0F1 ATP synthase subunit delta [Thiotrichaceae bacterium]|jgi:F-type H+-transporting ATPase subunit delta|nr:F0F1 ATP synthase subunit delta [Thiotrichaceae bacterium]HIM07325.1 F0F1 ATP synthase subunit delta [Gammaproteobacteria bacterium]